MDISNLQSVHMAQVQNFNHKATTWESPCRLPRNYLEIPRNFFLAHMQQNTIFTARVCSTTEDSVFAGLC